MDSKKRSLKSGNENGVIIAILAILLILVLAIVGVFILKDNAPVATFDGGKVTKKEYQVYYEMFSQYLAAYGYDANQIPEEILKKAAQDKMIVGDAKAAGVKISDEDKAEVDEIFGNEEYIDYFKANYSFSIDTLRQIYYNDYIMAAYIQKLADEAEDDKIAEYIKTSTGEENPDMVEFDTSHILFSFTKEDGTTRSDEEKAELKTKAQGVLDRALAGEDFAALAKEFSDDTTKDNGGKYAMYNDGYTVTEYSDTVKKMKAGEIYAELVETTYGYHIIKLNAINEGGRVHSETARTQYAQSQFENIVEERNLVYDLEKFKAYVKSLDSNAYADTNTDANTNADENSTDNTTTNESDAQDVTVGE